MRERFQLLAALGATRRELELRDRIEAFLDVVVPGFAVSRASSSSTSRTPTNPLVLQASAMPRTVRRPTVRCATTAWTRRAALVAQGGVFGSVTFGRASFSPGDHVLAIELSRVSPTRWRTHGSRARAQDRGDVAAEPAPARPRSAGARMGAYLPGTDLVVGGDFWDVIELPMQRLLLVVGDVAGRASPRRS